MCSVWGVRCAACGACVVTGFVVYYVVYYLVVCVVCGDAMCSM